MSTNTLFDNLFSSARWLALVVVVGAVLTLAAMAGRSWLSARDASTKLSATVSAQKQVMEQDDARQQARDAALTKSLSAIAQAKAAVKTPAQAAAQIPQALPPLPEPVAITVPPPQPSDPTPAATATVPQADLEPLYNYLEDCKACQDKLAASQSDLTDERNKVAALTTERDSAVKAAKGGGFWPRFRTAAKWFAIGAAVGAVSIAASHHFSP